ncbi:TerD family protein [Streptomyces sp. Je 1-79]|uniref:TerD family protein n=1 Tax=Streptomyces sp. Je 1-79 TaxID=2943847 RepID=UPI0021A267B5|nr:TerD family protein [Streptomyces sp. Je 1-79]MCT4352329.1 TerD family protein [Streptomyces sp. Je 1-79]
MIKGGNAFVPTVPLRIAVRNGVDVAVLLLTEQGRVRGDADIVFHGAPVHPSGAVRLLGEESGTVWLEAGLTAVEGEIVRVLVVGSTETGAMRDVHGLSVEAFAPDGTSVARYEVTDAGGETAMVLAELYRRAGGWKFRAVGQGYVNGLAGLATDHGVEVAENAPAQAEAAPIPFQPPPAAPSQAPAPYQPQAPVPPPQGPVPYQPPAPGFAPPSAPPPTVAAPPSPPPPPQPQPGGAPDWTYGSVFEPYVQTGRDNDVITVNGLPPGPVVVDLQVQGDGYTGLWPLTRFNKEGDSLVNSTEDNFRGRVLTQVPGNGRLRLQLKADGPWRIEVLPLAAATRLTEEELECRGPDVLLHTGGIADLALRYRGDDNLIINLYELAGHDDPAALPTDENVVNEIGRRRETVPLPEGPLIVHLEMADGPWRARLVDVQPHSRPRVGGGQANVTDISAAQGWLRRGRR